MFRGVLRIRIKTALFVIICTLILSVYVVKKHADKDVSDVDYRVLLWWTPFIYETKKVIECEGKYVCVVTKNRTYQFDSNLAVYVFYGSSFDRNDLPLPKGEIPWAIYHEESPKNLAFFLHKKGQTLFNITSTFSRNSDFPVPLQFLKNIHQITDTKYYVPVKRKNQLLQNIAPILYIQSDCDTPIERDSYVSELMKYIPIDSYGACLNNKKLPERLSLQSVLEDLYEEEFMSFIAQYKFIIAIENSICHDYITEKLWRPLIVGSIPIYLGSPTVEDWLPNSNAAVLMKNFPSTFQLAQHIHTINRNDDLYDTFMQHKISSSLENKITNRFLKSTLDKGDYGIENNRDYTIPAFECFVCKTVHKKSYKKHNKIMYDCKEPSSRNKDRENWWKTHWKNGKCEAKTLEYFLETKKVSNFTKEMFDMQYKKYSTNDDC